MTVIVIPEPRQPSRRGRYICAHRVRYDTDRWPEYECGRKFWLRASYDAHWVQEHRVKALPTVPRGPAPGSLSLEEQGRRLASRRDDLIALGVPDYLLDIPIAPGRYATRAPISAHDLGDIIAQRVRTVPDWALGPHCPHPEPHYQHDALCVIAEDGYHLTRKDTP